MVQTYQDFPASEKIRDSRPKIAARDEALRSNFAGAAAPTSPTPVAGQHWYDSVNDIEYRYNGTDWVPVGTQIDTATVVTFTNGDATPTVAAARQFTMADTNITNFDDGEDGQVIYVRGSSSNKSLIHDATKLQLGGVNLFMPVNAMATLIKRGSVWLLLATTTIRSTTLTPEQFGAVHDGVTNDWPAIKAMLLEAETLGGANCEFGPYTYRCGMASLSDAVVLDGLKYLNIKGNGATLDFSETVFGSGETAYPIQFKTSTGVDIGFLNVEWETYTDEDMANGEHSLRGGTTFFATDQCSKITVHDCHQIGGRNLFWTQRGSGDTALACTRKITMYNITTDRTGYGVAAANCGDELKVWNFSTYKAFRSVIIYGLSGFDIDIRSRDHWSTDLILAAKNDATDSPFLKNGRVVYTALDARAVDSFNAVCQLVVQKQGGSTPATISNVELILNYIGDAEDGLAYLVKAHSENDASALANIWENIEITGRAHIPTLASGATEMVSFFNEAGFAAGNQVARGIRFRDLFLTGSASQTMVVNLSPFDGALIMDNVQSVGTITRTNVSGAHTGLVHLRAVKDSAAEISGYTETSQNSATYTDFKNTLNSHELRIGGSQSGGNVSAGLSFLNGSTQIGRIYGVADGSLMDFFVGSTRMFRIAAVGTFTYTWSDDGAGAGPTQLLERVSASPAAFDGLGTYVFRGRDDAGNAHDYASFLGAIVSPTNGAEVGGLYLRCSLAGTLQNIALFQPTTFNNPDLELRRYDDGATGPVFMLTHSTASAAVNDVIGIVAWRGRDDAGNTQDYSRLRSLVVDPANGSEDSLIDLQTSVAGTIGTRLNVAQGVYTPNATGGDKGADSINASNVYDDNTLLTCFAIELARTGDIDLDFWDGLSPSGRHDAAHDLSVNRGMLDLESYTGHWRERGHLYGLPSRGQWADHARDKRPIGELVSGLWLTADLHAVHLAELHERVARLEAAA